MIRENFHLNREDAGIALGQKLLSYKNDDAVVVAIPHGGAPVGAALAKHLSLPFEVMPCRKIPHPAHREKTVAVVTAEEIFVHEIKGIPSDYIYHQTVQLRNAIRRETRYYYGDRPQPDYADKTVILVDDVLKDADVMLAAIRTIRKKKPRRIIVAVAVTVVMDPVVSKLEGFTYLTHAADRESVKALCAELPAVDDHAVRKFLEETNDELICFI
jgi:predicted phosphoribosyltransferase